MTTNKRELRTNVIILLFVLAALTIFISYLATHFTGETGVKSDEGLTFCEPENAPLDKQKCYFTAHRHFHFDINVCGEKRILSYETGDLQKAHTHVETGKIHWHGLLPVDPETQEVTDYSQLELRNMFAELKIPASESSIYNYKNGDKCPSGETGELKVFINGEEKQNFLDYIVKDKDKIKVEF